MKDVPFLRLIYVVLLLTINSNVVEADAVTNFPQAFNLTKLTEIVSLAISVFKTAPDHGVPSVQEDEELEFQRTVDAVLLKLKTENPYSFEKCYAFDNSLQYLIEGIAIKIQDRCDSQHLKDVEQRTFCDFFTSHQVFTVASLLKPKIVESLAEFQFNSYHDSCNFQETVKFIYSEASRIRDNMKALNKYVVFEKDCKENFILLFNQLMEEIQCSKSPQFCEAVEMNFVPFAAQVALAQTIFPLGTPCLLRGNLLGTPEGIPEGEEIPPEEVLLGAPETTENLPGEIFGTTEDPHEAVFDISPEETSETTENLPGDIFGTIEDSPERVLEVSPEETSKTIEHLLAGITRIKENSPEDVLGVPSEETPETTEISPVKESETPEDFRIPEISGVLKLSLQRRNPTENFGGNSGENGGETEGETTVDSRRPRVNGFRYHSHRGGIWGKTQENMDEIIGQWMAEKDSRRRRKYGKDMEVQSSEENQNVPSEMEGRGNLEGRSFLEVSRRSELKRNYEALMVHLKGSKDPESTKEALKRMAKLSKRRGFQGNFRGNFGKIRGRGLVEIEGNLEENYGKILSRKNRNRRNLGGNEGDEMEVKFLRNGNQRGEFWGKGELNFPETGQFLTVLRPRKGVDFKARMTEISRKVRKIRGRKRLFVALKRQKHRGRNGVKSEGKLGINGRRKMIDLEANFMKLNGPGIPVGGYEGFSESDFQGNGEFQGGYSEENLVEKRPINLEVFGDGEGNEIVEIPQENDEFEELKEKERNEISVRKTRERIINKWLENPVFLTCGPLNELLK